MSEFVEIRHPDLLPEYPCSACDGTGVDCYTCLKTGVVTRPPSLVPASTVDHWRSLGWELVEVSTFEDTEPVFVVSAPAKSAGKAEWAVYAESLGIDPAGLSKADLITAVESATSNEE